MCWARGNAPSCMAADCNFVAQRWACTKLYFRRELQARVGIPTRTNSQEARSTEKSRMGSRCLHVSAFKAIVHQLTSVDSYKEACQWSSPPSWRCSGAYSVGGASPASPPRNAQHSSPHGLGVFPSGSFFGEMHSIMLSKVVNF